MSAGSDHDIRIVGAADVDQEELRALLEEAGGPAFAGFYIEHGDWWHRGSGGRFVASCDGVIAGYRATVPNVVLVGGREVPGVWGMHLYVTPRFRGMGLQRLLDQRLLEAADLRMSFPNTTGAKIYEKQGYGLREDIRLLRLPLHPRAMHPTAAQIVRDGSGSHALALRAAATTVSPLAALFRVRARRYRPTRTEFVTTPDLAEMKKLCRRSVNPNLTTTLRSTGFLRWRYLEAPYRQDLTFYQTTLRSRPTHFAIVRHMSSAGSVTARILDIFGDLADEHGLADMLRTIVRDATCSDALYVDLLVSSPEFQHTARSVGFILSKGRRFRWGADDLATHDALFSAPLHWTMGDGEHDAPV